MLKGSNQVRRADWRSPLTWMELKPCLLPSETFLLRRLFWLRSRNKLVKPEWKCWKGRKKKKKTSCGKYMDVRGFNAAANLDSALITYSSFFLLHPLLLQAVYSPSIHSLCHYISLINCNFLKILKSIIVLQTWNLLSFCLEQGTKSLTNIKISAKTKKQPSGQEKRWNQSPTRPGGGRLTRARCSSSRSLENEGRTLKAWSDKMKRNFSK